jgi:VanZ family protein
MPRKIFYWGPPLLWMGVIFYFSSFPRVIVIHNSLYAFLFYKTLHIIEYAILYFLLFRAFYSIDDRKLSLSDKFIFVILISILYSLSDEIHQTFIRTREGRLQDVFIDTSGILLMYIYIRSSLNKLKKYFI